MEPNNLWLKIWRFWKFESSSSILKPRHLVSKFHGKLANDHILQLRTMERGGNLARKYCSKWPYFCIYRFNKRVHRTEITFYRRTGSPTSLETLHQTASPCQPACPALPSCIDNSSETVRFSRFSWNFPYPSRSSPLVGWVSSTLASAPSPSSHRSPSSYIVLHFCPMYTLVKSVNAEIWPFTAVFSG